MTPGTTPGAVHPAGWLDGSDATEAGWRLSGWMLDPRMGPFERVEVYWKGQSIGTAATVSRPDLADQIYWLRNVERSGVSVVVPERDADGVLELIGLTRGRARARLSTNFVAPHLDPFPVPSERLALRVSDLSGDAFRLSGLKAATDLLEQVVRYRPGELAGLRMLDWGVGCGRVSRNLARVGVGDLSGCDIDREAIAWCRRHLPGAFHVTGLDPPLPYPDASFDIVIATSVFTHLARERQHRWLDEVSRVLSPGGLLLASVAGPDVARLGRPLRLGSRPPGSPLSRAAALRRVGRLHLAGIIDYAVDKHLHGIAPRGYYRSTYQTRRYTRNAWVPYLDVAGYVSRGLNGHQDLVVLAKRAP